MMQIARAEQVLVPGATEMLARIRDGEWEIPERVKAARKGIVVLGEKTKPKTVQRTGFENWVLKASEEEEEECNSGWVTELNARNINDFTDLNEGEKSFLNLWNLHMDTLVNHGVGFGHMRDILECFLSNHGHSIVQLNLYR